MSGRVTLLNDYEPHRHLRTFFYKTLKSDNFLPSYDPSKQVCFFHFPGFTDFQRAVTLLLVKIFLNFKNTVKMPCQSSF
jgi:hypothetical protein